MAAQFGQDIKQGAGIGGAGSASSENLQAGEGVGSTGGSFGSAIGSYESAEDSYSPASNQSNASVVGDYSQQAFIADPDASWDDNDIKAPIIERKIQENARQDKTAASTMGQAESQQATSPRRILGDAMPIFSFSEASAGGSASNVPMPPTSVMENQLSGRKVEPARAQTASTPAMPSNASYSESASDTFLTTPGSVRAGVSPAVQSAEPSSVAPKDIIENAAKPSSYTGKRHPGLVSRAYDKVKNRLAGKRTVATGNNVNSKAVTHPNIQVGIREVSVGTDILLDSIRQNSVLLSRVNAYADQRNLKNDFKYEDFLGSNEQYMLEQLAKTINRLEIPVVLSKAPISEQTSMQKRILRVHFGQGISIHPLAAKGFVADFDGDGATVHFGEELLGSALDAMECLYSIDGKTPLIDFDFMLLPDIDVDSFTKILDERRVKNARRIAEALKAKNAEMFCDAAIDIESFSERAYAIDIACQKASEIFKQGILQIPDNSRYHVPSKIDHLDMRPEERALYNMINEPGEMPPNYQDFVSALARFDNDIAGKNPHFRVGADLGKLIKFDQEVFVGEEDFLKLYQQTCKAINAKIMSGKAFMGEERESISEWKQITVIGEAGFPAVNFDGSERSFSGWYDDFRRAYNECTAMAEMSKNQFRMDMSAIKVEVYKKSLPSIEQVNAGELAKAVIEIYGDYSMEKIFGFKRAFGNEKSNSYKKAMLSKYAAMSVRKFSQINHCVTTAKPNEKHFSNNTDGNDSRNWENLFEAIADRRSGKASKYNKNLVENLSEQLNVISRMNKMIERDEYDAKIELDNCTKLLASCGPDIYAYFGMENTEAFLQSEWGKLMSKAVTADQLGGIRYAMVVEYRLDKIANLVRRQAESASSLEKIDIDVQIGAELDILASSSDVWAVIVSEINHNNALWNEFTSTGFKAIEAHLGKNAVSNVIKLQGESADKNDFSEYLDSGKWPTVLDFASDPAVGKDAKDAVISDLARMNSRYQRINGYEVAYMLEADPSSTYAGSNTLGWSESSDDVLKDSLDNMRRPTDTSYIGVIDDMDDKDVMQIVNYLSEPSNFFKIDDSLYSDAVVAAMDKTYADTEKSKQQASVSALYTALSYQINGGLYSDVYRGDNRALGRIGWDQVSPMDLMKALSDPDFEVLVYDEAGNISTLSRESLCGGVDDSDVVAFLRKNERFVAFLRGMTAIVQDGSDGKVTVAARMSVLDTLRAAQNGPDPRDKALFTLRDHPGWGAMCALFTPVHGRSSRNQRFAVQATEQRLLEAISYYKKTGEMPDLSGLKRQDRSIRRIMKDLSKRGVWDKDMFSNTEHVVRNLFMKYANEINTDGIKATPLNPIFDAESVRMFYDTRQILNGAKTAVSTGVEGAETKKTAPSFVFFASLQNKYMKDQDGNIVPNDGTVGSASGPLKRIFVNPFAKFFAVKRAKGGEEFNLKAKKAGDDGLDSITKSRKYPGRNEATWKYIADELSAIYDVDKDVSSVEKHLGSWLKECNHDLKYNDMDDVDYANIAHLLVKETDNGIVVRSLGQIASAIRNQLPMYMDVSDFKNAEISQILKHSNDIAERCGTGEADILGILYGMRLPSTAAFKPATRQRSSSRERNFELIKKLDAIVKQAPKSDRALWLTPDQRQANHNVLKKRVPESDLDWTSGQDGYSIMGVFNGIKDEWRAVPGAANVLVVTEDAGIDSFNKAAEIARKYNMTLVYPTSHDYRVSKFISKNSIPEPNGSTKYMMVPFFDIELNGYGEAKSGRTYFNESNVVISVEDSLNEHGLGDAAAVGTDHFFERTNVKKSGEWSDDATDMFAVTMDRYSGKDFSFRIATREEIEDNIINWSYPDIDIRVDMSNKDWSEISDKVSRQIAEFTYDWDLETSVNKGRPDRIVGWAAVDIRDSSGILLHTTFAPITPFTKFKGNTKSVPNEFDITPGTMRFDEATGNFVFSWTHKGSLENQFIKFHEGLAAGNKMMAFTSPVADRVLKSGRNIDVMYAANTTSSRRLGWNARLQTMYSMMLQARLDPYGYNFAEHAESLPENPELKARMLAGELPLSEWLSMDISNIRWHQDPQINSFVKNEIKMCLDRGIHPDDFLASRYTESDGKTRNTMCYFEFDMLFKPSFRYQNDLMKFMHFMMPTLCPENINDDSEDYLFKPCKDRGWSYGALQQQVPRLDKEGNVITYTWENVYASFGFFSDDYSGFHSPGVDAADVMTQELAVAVQNGMVGDNGRLLGSFMEWAFSEAAGESKPTSWNAADINFDVTDEDAPIDSFRGEYSFLSNMYDSPVSYNGMTYKNAEAAFQAQKDPSKASEFVGLSGKEAKSKGGIKSGEITPRPDWDEVKTNIMMEIVSQKFIQNESLAEKLKSTGDRRIIEGNTWGDTEWGVYNGKGDNKLGKILEEVRRSLNEN